MNNSLSVVYEEVPIIIKVGMADYKITSYPNNLTTIGLGSCVGISLIDLSNNIIGMAHIMLPSSNAIANTSNIAKFADTAIIALYNDMIKIGANRNRLVAKIAGGAQMFANITSDYLKVGLRNVEATKNILNELKIPLIAEDTGGSVGRTIELFSVDGKLNIKTVGLGIKQI